MALIVAVLGGALLTFYLRRFEEEKSGGEPIELLAAVKPVAAGDLITEDMLATRVVPRAYVEDRAVLASEKAKVLGLRMGHTLQAQQTLMWTDLNIAMEERRSLSSLVQPGMRAVTVRSRDTQQEKSFSLIRPGDRVDVILTMPGQKESDARTAVVLLQNIMVLAVGVDTGADPTKTGIPDRNEIVLSLSLNIQEAQLLALAAEKGSINVAVRNPDDVRAPEGIPEMSAAVLTDSKSRAQVQGIRKTGPVKIDVPGGK